MPQPPPKFLQQHTDTAAPHAGTMIKRRVLSTGLNLAELGRRIGRTTTTIHRSLKGQSIQSAIIWEMCHALKYNFFADIAAQLPATYASAHDNKLEEEIADLRAQLKATEKMLEKAMRDGMKEEKS